MHELLRFSTAGSVDDGKSTLIGRLLFDSKSIFEDQLESLAISTKRRGREGIDLALLTDGLAAEREQGITIDVAYRYFSTPKRKFIIADTPGHEQYTRNMVTGASTADLAVILVDAQKGVSTQARRHTYISHLLGIQHILVCINKMDLVDYSKKRFIELKQEFLKYVKDLQIPDVRFLPISALHGDNVVEKSSNTTWFEDESLLHTLENIEIAQNVNYDNLRIPVQYVNRPHANFRGYCGMVSRGVVRSEQDVVILPSQKKTKIKSIHTFDGEKKEAFPPQSVTLLLEDDIDISRGDMIVDPHNPPKITQKFTAQICWMTDEPLSIKKKYYLKHTTKTVKAIVTDIDCKINISSLEQEKATEIHLNDIAQIQIKTTEPLALDCYKDNRFTGCFILIDETTNNTVGAGIITGL